MGRKAMELKAVLERYHEQIIETWFKALRSDRSGRYYQEPADDLRSLISRAAQAFHEVLVADQWGSLQAFITSIAKKRFGQGFKVSEVQKAFELYRQTLIPLLIAELDPAEICAVMLRLQRCMVFTITSFSEFFQEIHEEFLRSHADSLEREVARRTEELAKSQRKYKTLVEDINDGYFVVVDGEIAFANQSFAKMHGYLLRDVLKVNYLNFVAPESHKKVEPAYESSRTKGIAPTCIEYLRLCKDGRKLPTEIIAKLSTFSNQPANIGICRDISERVALEKKIRETEKLKALAKQASSLAHEVRNPLSAIRMNLQIIEQSESDPVRLRLLDISLREITRIERSLQEMMDLSIPFRMNRKHVDLRSLLTNSLQAMHQRIANNKLTVSLRLSRQIKNIRVDPYRLEQAIVNLLFNAIEAQPSTGKIFLSSRPINGKGRSWVEITVGDSGPGIAKEILPYLFDPMFTQKSKGTGIGLSNVKKIVEAHGGEIRVKPRRPEGTNFCMRLPLK